MTPDQKFRAQLAAMIYAGMARDLVEELNKPREGLMSNEEIPFHYVRSALGGADAIIGLVKERSL